MHCNLPARACAAGVPSSGGTKSKEFSKLVDNLTLFLCLRPSRSPIRELPLLSLSLCIILVESVSVVAFEISDGIANFTVLLVCLPPALFRSSLKPFSDETTGGGDGGKASDMDDNSVISVLIVVVTLVVVVVVAAIMAGKM